MPETPKPKRASRAKAKPAAQKAPDSVKEIYARLVSLINRMPKTPDKKAENSLAKEALAASKILKGLLEKAERKLAGIKKLAQ
jgi:hypothetical protein